jgi:thiamine pyrophosphokinase
MTSYNAHHDYYRETAYSAGENHVKDNSGDHMKNSMKGSIVCNGRIADPEWARTQIATSDLVVAVDGGTTYLQAMGITPHAIVGDMDSLGEHTDVLNGDIERVQFPEEKSQTDTELAVEFAFKRGCHFACLFGATGGRPDHMLGNICLLVKYLGRIAIFDSRSTLVAVDRSEKCLIHGKPGAIVSLIPFPFAERVSTSGLKYVLKGEDLSPGTRGISNVLSEPEACVCIGGGLLLVYVENELSETE